MHVSPHDCMKNTHRVATDILSKFATSRRHTFSKGPPAFVLLVGRLPRLQHLKQYFSVPFTNSSALLFTSSPNPNIAARLPHPTQTPTPFATQLIPHCIIILNLALPSAIATLPSQLLPTQNPRPALRVSPTATAHLSPFSSPHSTHLYNHPLSNLTSPQTNSSRFLLVLSSCLETSTPNVSRSPSTMLTTAIATSRPAGNVTAVAPTQRCSSPNPPSWP